MREVLSREQVQRFDKNAATSGVPSLLLMENAGRGAADWLVTQSAWLSGRILVLAGPGNNGGDGWSLARRLHTLGYDVEVASSVEPRELKGDARQLFHAYEACGGTWSLIASRIEALPMGPLSSLHQSGALSSRGARIPAGALGAEDALPFNSYSLLVDALWGTGVTREFDALAYEWIERINDCGIPVVALDLPSGLDADTGAQHGICVRAEATLTFAYLKAGLLTPNGREFGGRCHIIDIGVPPRRGWWQERPESEPLAFGLETADVALWLKDRRSPRHKGEAGRILVVAGSPGATGAARLCAYAAQRAGAGLVTFGARADIADELSRDLWEAMLFRLDNAAFETSLRAALAPADAVVLGPGLGLDELGARIVAHVVSSYAGRLVMDADALTHYSGKVETLQSAAGELMLTPHPGEAARLLGIETRQVEANRFEAVKQLAERSGATVLLKGPCTLLCGPGHSPWIVERGAPVLATAGSGDVLAGIAAALACQLHAMPALASAAWIHACAGERIAAQRPLGVLARELADSVPEVMAELMLLPA